jgi:uncharacterized protein YdhG (YjbR/CyaY superfamily)
MAEGKTTKGGRDTGSDGWTTQERAAMKERAKEMRSARSSKKSGEEDLLEKVAEMPKADRVMAERLHAAITAAAPSLESKTWYGMPAYARDGKVVCFFQAAAKFDARYASFGFNDTANLDKGAMWPVAFALKELTDADLAKLITLVKRAVK